MRTLVVEPDCFCGIEVVEPFYTEALVRPDGKFFRVELCHHEHAAWKHGNTTVDILEAEGWLHLSTDYIGYVANQFGQVEYKVATQSQIDVLFTILLDIEAEIAKRKDAGYEFRFMRMMDNHRKSIKSLIEKGSAN